MRTYSLLLDDDRYGLPAEVYVMAASAGQARARAAELLLRSAHHCGITAFVGHELHFRLGERRSKSGALPHFLQSGPVLQGQWQPTATQSHDGTDAVAELSDAMIPRPPG